MKQKLLKRVGLMGLLVLGLAQSVYGATDQQPIIVVFYEEGCPSCVQMEAIVEEYVQQEYPSLSVSHYELTQPGSLDVLERLCEAYDVSEKTVPIIFVGNHVILGAERAAEMNLRSEIEKCLMIDCPSPLERITKSGISWGDISILGLFASVFGLLYLLQGL
jgi:thiol-disulfide isomerase/thioredoxin